MNGVIKTGAKFIGIFLVIIVAMYFLYPLIHPQDKQEKTKEDEWGASDLKNNPFDYNLEAADTLKVQINQLQQSIDSLKNLEQQYQVKVDSLERLASQTEKEPEQIETAEENNENELVSAEQLKDVSRSLLELDEEELSPILDKLNNNELIGLYKSANNMQRSKMLRSLGSDKAARILKEII